MKKIISIIFLCFFIFISNKSIGYEEDSTYVYYKKLSSQEHINNLLTIEDLLIWFNPQVDDIIMSLKEQGKYKVVIYKFGSKVSVAQLELYYIEEECQQMILKSNINGSSYKDNYSCTFYNDSAKRIILMYLSYNNEFEYHSK